MAAVTQSPAVTTTKGAPNAAPRTRLEILGLVAVLGLSAFLNLWNLGANGWANAYYSAAVQSGLHSFEAFFFGSADWGNAISVDKPPLSLWLMGLSVRIFGLNTWGILLPQALLGTGSTYLAYSVLRRYLSPISGLVGALVLATTPVAVLMSRYNNPDALLAFLLLAAFAAAMRGRESSRMRWVLISGILLGLAILTKQLQALLVGPAIAAVLLSGRRHELWLTVRRAAAFVLPFLAVAASWIGAVNLVPTSQRPYLGSTEANSAVELTFGFNGLDRLTGISDPGAVFLPAPFGQSGSDAGPLRLLNVNNAQEAGWLLPAAFVALALLVAGRTSFSVRGATTFVVSCAVWFVTVFGVLSFMGNGFHTYYADALAVPLALVVGSAVHVMTLQPGRRAIRWVAASGLLVGTLTAWLILGTLQDTPSWLQPLVLGCGISATSLAAVRPPVRALSGLAAVLVCGVLAGPLFSDAATLGAAEGGALPLSGAVAAKPLSMSHLMQELHAGDLPAGLADLAFGRALPADVVDLLNHAPPTCTWAAATAPAQSAALAQLASGRPVLALGGYQATDPWPTADAFRAEVSAGRVCYLIDQPALDPVTSQGTAAGAIVSWVRSHFSSTTMNGVVVFDLRNPTAP